ncbi:DNA helicase [Mycobacterium phage Myrna]|uniref:DNA helicase n=1 Tax=Mycobacterium phage Myrna TaxID=546805 RepID=B5LJE8_9CAUD|nr:gp176 [Mycobacterium phage Myrna]ACH62145.1 DNA helicase [Mycobacterium phage Myrna]
MAQMHLPADDVDAEIERLLNVPIHPDRIAMVQEHPDYPGCLYFDVGDWDNRQEFYRAYHKWMSRHLVLNETFLLDPFLEHIAKDGWAVIFEESTRGILEDHARWSTPFEVPGYELLDYQVFSLNKALERHLLGRKSNEERFFFWNWSAGAGKSFCAGAAIRRLQEYEGLGMGVDLVIAATTSDLKINLYRFLHNAGLDAVLTDGGKPRRRKIYSGGHHVLVMNFEKLKFDYDEISALTKGKRVLFILDEAQKLIADEGQNQTRAALDKLTRECEATVWPMSATVVGPSPLRFRDVFSLDGHPRSNPLGTKKDFVERYAREVKTKMQPTRNGGSFPLTTYNWDHAKLQEVRHRVADRTMAVRRKSNMPTIPVMVQASDGQREAFEVITEEARKAVLGKGLDPGPYMRLLQMVAITPEALRVTEDQIAADIMAEHPHLAEGHAPKIDLLNEMLDGIAEQYDQAVCFVHWTTGGLHLISPKLRVRHVKHWGTGQSRRLSQKAVDTFKAQPNVVAFLSSDAGALGLSFQNARYVINIDPIRDYDLLTQRNKRIDRADSYLEGLTSYVMITEDSVEERIWHICQARMRLSAATQGTTEELTPEDIELAEMPEEVSNRWVLFGE